MSIKVRVLTELIKFKNPIIFIINWISLMFVSIDDDRDDRVTFAGDLRKYTMHTIGFANNSYIIYITDFGWCGE